VCWLHGPHSQRASGRGITSKASPREIRPA
jgi:hypothetical protein